MSAKIFCLSSNFYCLLDLLASKAFIVFILEGFYTKEVFQGGTEKNYYIYYGKKTWNKNSVMVI